MFTQEVAGILGRLSGREVPAPFVESAEVLAYGPAANRVARLRLEHPAIGERLLRLNRSDWHSACAYVLATQHEDAHAIAARLLDGRSPQALLAEAMGMQVVNPACFKLLKHAPPCVLPLDGYRLLAWGSQDPRLVTAYRGAIANTAVAPTGAAFAELLVDVTMAWAEDPLAAELDFIPPELRVGLSSVIRSLRLLGLLLPEKEERRCLRRLRNTEDFARWSERRLKGAVAPESAFGWLTTPVPGFEPIKSAAALIQQARSMQNCAKKIRYTLELCAGLSTFAILRPIGDGPTLQEHLVQLHVSGRYVRIVEFKRARNNEPLTSARLHLEQVFKANGLLRVDTGAGCELDWMMNDL